MESIGDIEILFKDDGPKATDHPLYPGFKQGSTILKQGSLMKKGALALPCDIIWERDIPLKLRDGITIYTDVYRPLNAKYLCPAIISSSGFGKNGGLNRKMANESPWRTGIPQATVSGLEKFEALDPAYWCLHGYVLVHPGDLIQHCTCRYALTITDIRGTWMSEGDTYINSTLDGKDGYDIVEWVAEQSWSNGR